MASEAQALSRLEMHHIKPEQQFSKKMSKITILGLGKKRLMARVGAAKSHLDC